MADESNEEWARAKAARHVNEHGGPAEMVGPDTPHDVDWHGTFRGTDEDPRETGWCNACRRDVYDGEGPHRRTPDTECDDRDGSGRYFIDGEPQACICSESQRDTEGDDGVAG